MTIIVTVKKVKKLSHPRFISTLTYDIEWVEGDASEGEEAEYGLDDGLGHAHHAGGEGGADGRAQELRVGEHTAGEDEQREHQAEPRLQAARARPDGGGLAQHEAEGEEDGQRVVAVDVQHLQDPLVVLLRALLHEGEVAGLGHSQCTHDDDQRSAFRSDSEMMENFPRGVLGQ